MLKRFLDFSRRKFNMIWERLLSSPRRGFAMILVAFFIPVVLAGLNWIIKYTKSSDLNITASSIPYIVTQTIAEHYIPGTAYSSQSSRLYSLGAQAYNDRYYSINKTMAFEGNGSSGFKSETQNVSGVSNTVEFYHKYASTGDKTLVTNTEFSPVVLKSNNPLFNVTFGSISYYHPLEKGDNSGSINFPNYSQDTKKLTVTFNSTGIVCTFPELKKKATATLPQCDVDIVIAIPTNHAACTADNTTNGSTVSLTDATAIAGTPIRQIAGACQDFLRLLVHTPGIAVGIVPYSGKISLPPDRSNWTIRYPMNSSLPNRLYITSNMFYGSDGKKGGSHIISSNPATDDDYGDYRYWGKYTVENSVKPIGCPIMSRRGSAISESGVDIYASKVNSTKLLLNTGDPSNSDKYKFIRMNTNPCYGGHNNIIADCCEKACNVYLSNPYYICELTADLPSVIRDLGLFIPFADDHNKSNFLFLAPLWASNLFQGWTKHPETSLTDTGNYLSQTERQNKKKVVIIIANAPDNFEPNEMTYLGFDNDYSEIPVIESDCIRFDVDYGDKTIQGPKGMLVFSTTSGSVAYNKDVGYYECPSAIGRLEFATKRLVTLEVEPIASVGTIQFTNIKNGSDGSANTSQYTIRNKRKFIIEASQIIDPPNTDANANCSFDFEMKNIRLLSAEITNRPYEIVQPNVSYKGSGNTTTFKVNCTAPFVAKFKTLNLKSTASITYTAIDGTSTSINIPDPPYIQFSYDSHSYKYNPDEEDYAVSITCTNCSVESVSPGTLTNYETSQDVTLDHSTGGDGSFTHEGSTFTYKKTTYTDTAQSALTSTATPPGTITCPIGTVLTVSAENNASVTFYDSNGVSENVEENTLTERKTFTFSGSDNFRNLKDEGEKDKDGNDLTQSLSDFSTSGGKNFGHNLSTKKLKYSLEKAKLVDATLSNQLLRCYAHYDYKSDSVNEKSFVASNCHVEKETNSDVEKYTDPCISTNDEKYNQNEGWVWGIRKVDDNKIITSQVEAKSNENEGEAKDDYGNKLKANSHDDCDNYTPTAISNWKFELKEKNKDQQSCSNGKCSYRCRVSGTFSKIAVDTPQVKAYDFNPKCYGVQKGKFIMTACNLLKPEVMQGDTNLAISSSSGSTANLGKNLNEISCNKYNVMDFDLTGDWVKVFTGKQKYVSKQGYYMSPNSDATLTAQTKSLGITSGEDTQTATSSDSNGNSVTVTFERGEKTDDGIPCTGSASVTLAEGATLNSFESNLILNGKTEETKNQAGNFGIHYVRGMLLITKKSYAKVTATFETPQPKTCTKTLDSKGNDLTSNCATETVKDCEDKCYSNSVERTYEIEKYCGTNCWQPCDQATYKNCPCNPTYTSARYDLNNFFFLNSENKKYLEKVSTDNHDDLKKNKGIYSLAEGDYTWLCFCGDGDLSTTFEPETATLQLGDSKYSFNAPSTYYADAIDMTQSSSDKSKQEITCSTTNSPTISATYQYQNRMKVSLTPSSDVIQWSAIFTGRKKDNATYAGVMWDDNNNQKISANTNALISQTFKITSNSAFSVNSTNLCITKFNIVYVKIDPPAKFVKYTKIALPNRSRTADFSKRSVGISVSMSQMSSQVEYDANIGYHASYASIVLNIEGETDCTASVTKTGNVTITTNAEVPLRVSYRVPKAVAKVQFIGENGVKENIGEYSISAPTSYSFSGSNHFRKLTSGVSSLSDFRTSGGKNFGMNLGTKKLKCKLTNSKVSTASLSNQLLRCYGCLNSDESPTQNNNGHAEGETNSTAEKYTDPCVCTKDGNYQSGTKKEGASGWKWTTSGTNSLGMNQKALVNAYNFCPKCYGVQKGKFIMSASDFPSEMGSNTADDLEVQITTSGKKKLGLNLKNLIENKYYVADFSNQTSSEFVQISTGKMQYKSRVTFKRNLFSSAFNAKTCCTGNCDSNKYDQFGNYAHAEHHFGDAWICGRGKCVTSSTTSGWKIYKNNDDVSGIKDDLTKIDKELLDFGQSMASVWSLGICCWQNCLFYRTQNTCYRTYNRIWNKNETNPYGTVSYDGCGNDPSLYSPAPSYSASTYDINNFFFLNTEDKTYQGTVTSAGDNNLKKNKGIYSLADGNYTWLCFCGDGDLSVTFEPDRSILESYVKDTNNGHSVSVTPNFLSDQTGVIDIVPSKFDFVQQQDGTYKVSLSLKNIEIYDLRPQRALGFNLSNSDASGGGIPYSEFGTKSTPGDFYFLLEDIGLTPVGIKIYDRKNNHESYNFSGLHTRFQEYENIKDSTTARFDITNSHLAGRAKYIFAGLTLPINAMLVKNGYQTINLDQTPNQKPTEAIKTVATEACNKLKDANAKIYLIKYRTTASLSLENCSGITKKPADSEAKLKTVLEEIAADIKKDYSSRDLVINVEST